MYIARFYERLKSPIEALRPHPALLNAMVCIVPTFLLREGCHCNSITTPCLLHADSASFSLPAAPLLSTLSERRKNSSYAVPMRPSTRLLGATT
jgi:hypothetical protein